jgi:apolipoprotein N-acyltransferase
MSTPLRAPVVRSRAFAGWLAAVWPFAGAVAAGIALPLAMSPFDWWPLSLAAIALLFWLLADVTPRRALWLGYAFGIGKYGFGVSWIYVSIHQYGDASPPLAAFLVLLFVLGMAWFTALLAWVYVRWIRQSAAWLVNAIAFAAAFVVLEWLLTWFLTGFPWLFAGYAHLETPLGHLAPVGSVLLVGFAAAVCACALVAAARLHGRPRWAALGTAAAPWLLGALAGAFTWVQPGAPGTVALVQGNIPQSTKWDPATVQPILDTYRELSAPHWHHDLVIWPEAAVTLFAHEAVDYLEAMGRRAAQHGGALVLGVPAAARTDDGIAIYNSVVAVGNGRGTYSKHRLVPFGDYVPFERWLRGLIGFFDLPMSVARPGPRGQPPLSGAGRDLAVAICYEIAYPQLVRASALDADVIVTVSNDTWFGRSIGPHQHMQKARMRALENGRFVLRSTNNGITAIVDPAGRVTAQLPQFQAGVLTGDFHSMSGQTPYARFGTVPLLVLLAATIGGAALVGRRRA